MGDDGHDDSATLRYFPFVRPPVTIRAPSVDLDKETQILREMDPPVILPPEDLVVSFDPSTARDRVVLELRIPQRLSEYVEVLRSVVLDVLAQESEFLPLLQRIQHLLCSNKGIIVCLHAWKHAVDTVESGALDLCEQASLLHGQTTWTEHDFVLPGEMGEHGVRLVQRYREWLARDDQTDEEVVRIEMCVIASGLLCAVQDLHHVHGRDIASLKKFVSGDENPLATFIEVSGWFVGGLSVFFNDPFSWIEGLRGVFCLMDETIDAFLSNKTGP